jgi:hypothetical protein
MLDVLVQRSDGNHGQSYRYSVHDICRDYTPRCHTRCRRRKTNCPNGEKWPCGCVRPKGSPVIVRCEKHFWDDTEPEGAGKPLR